MRHNVFLLVIIISMMGIASASPYSSNINQDSGNPYSSNINQHFITFDNATASVNNSQYFQGHTPTTLKDWMQSAFDSVYCKLTGCSMTGDLDTTGDVEANTFTLDGEAISRWDEINATAEEDNIYKIYFSHSMNNIITYNLTKADASIITINTVGGQKEIYGGEFT